MWLIDVAALIAETLVTNGDMESWTAGTSVPPTGWTLAGAGATIAKNTTAGQFHGGTASASLTRNGFDCDVRQDPVTTARPLSWWRGRTVTCTAWVRATVAGRALLSINDGVSFTNSSHHSGSGIFERLSVTYRVRDDAISLVYGLVIQIGNTTAQIDDAAILWSNGRFSGGDLDELPDFYAGALLDEPTITRRLQETRWGPVEVQDVTVTLANIDSALTPGYRSDLRETSWTLRHYDRVTSLITTEWTGVVSNALLGRGTLRLEGTNLDLAVLEEEIPRGLIDKDTYSLAEPGSIGRTPPWLFGTVYSLPLPYIRDDLPHSLFDYLVCRDRALTLAAVWRLGSNQTRFAVASTECSVVEPVFNGNFEQWDAGNGGPPTSWTLAGAGATATRNTTTDQFWEGVSATNLTRAGADALLSQDIVVGTMPIKFWHGRTVTVRCRVRAGTANSARVALQDSATMTPSAFHSGSGLFEWLQISHAVAGTATSLHVRCDVITTNGTAQFDALEVLVPAQTWEDALRTDIDAGASVLRFFQRQDDSSDQLYQLIADVHGVASLANPARAVRTLLTDPASGLGKTVNAESFDAAEIALCLDYRSAVRLDDPEVFYDFEDRSDAIIMQDTSGHLRHGSLVFPAEAQWTTGPNTNDSGDIALYLPNTTAFIFVPYGRWMEPALSVTGAPDTLSVEVWYRPVANGGDRPIIAKTANLGATTTQYALHHLATGVVQFDLLMRVPASTASLSTAVSVGVYTHIVGTYSAATGQRLYKNGVLVASATPAGTPDGDATGEALLIGCHATLATLANGAIDKVAIYRTALPAARVLAHFNARAVNQNPVDTFTPAVEALSPSLYWPLTERSGTVASEVIVGTDGTYSGGPTLGVPGPMVTTRRGTNTETAVSFENTVSKYVSVTGQPLNGAAMTILCWWKPDLPRARSGIIDKTVAGTLDSQWSLSQTPEGTIRFRLKDATAAQRDTSFTLIADDPGRWMLLAATFTGGTMRLYKNGVEMDTETYTAPPAAGVGNMYFGRFVSADGNGAQGDLGHVAIWATVALDAEQIYSLAVAGTWAPGSLDVALAMTEPRQAQDWLAQIFQMRGMRLGVDALGAYTLTPDNNLGDIVLAIGDGPGDGIRNLLDLQARHRTALPDAVSELVLKYRRDLVTGTLLAECRRTVSAHGKELLIESDVIRDHTTADRVAHYLAARMTMDETVEAMVVQDGVQVLEGDRVTLTDPDMGYSGETLEVLEVQKQLDQMTLVLGEPTTARLTYVPAVLPIGGGPG